MSQTPEQLLIARQNALCGCIRGNVSDALLRTSIPGGREMKGAIALASVLVLALLMSPVSPSEDDAEWRHIGQANEVVGMAAMHGKLYSATRYNALWVREPVPRDVRWQALGHANRVAALAGADGKLFGVTTDHKLWMREVTAEDAPWHHIGYADGVVAIAAMGRRLYAATRGNKLLVCDIDPWNIRWRQVGDAAQVRALASLDGKLYAATEDRKLWSHDPAPNAPWQYLSEGMPIVALAGLGGKLYAATQDNKLWMRTPHEGLHVVDIRLEAPDWLQAGNASRKALVSMTFNRAIAPSMLEGPGTVAIDLRGLTSGRLSPGVPGTFQYSADARTAVFTSERTLEELIHPQANEMIEYRITLMMPGTHTHASQRQGKGPGGRGTADETAGRLVRVLRKPYVGAQLSEGRVF
jgi:hypothetical protein